MKTTTFLRTALAISAVALVFTSCKKDDKTDPKPKPVEITYVIKNNPEVKDLKFTSLTVSGHKGQDSTISKDLKFPMTIKVKRSKPAKKSTVAIKAKVDKVAKLEFEILMDGKSVKKGGADIKDIKEVGSIVHTF